jgi:hypothetical protein
MVGQQGFTIDVWRVFSQGGKEIKRVKETTVYRPETDLKCVPATPATPDTTTADTSDTADADDPGVAGDTAGTVGDQ